MTAISSIDTIPADPPSQSKASDNILGKNDFLHLLITQLQHQDPLNPAESTEFTAQLAQFSSLEQLSNINENLKNMELFQESITNSQAVSYIGTHITAQGNSVEVKDDQPAECHFELAEDANLVAISIYDANGAFVNTFETDSLSAGRQTAIWDGTDSNGNAVAHGVYRFEVQAADVNNEGVDITPLIRTLVTGVSFQGQTTHLITRLQTVAIEDVIDVTAVEPLETVAVPLQKYK